MKLEEIVRYQIPVKIVVVDKIEDDRGKIRYIISDLALEMINLNVR